MFNKIILTVLSILLSIVFGFSQDTLSTRTGEIIPAKVLEVGPAQIRYQKSDNPNGPAYLISKSDLQFIKYENGTKDIFNDTKNIEQVVVPDSSRIDLFVKGQSDAMRYYNGYKIASTGTLITALLSPLAGLVPAIACSVSKPKESRLNYPDPELMKVPAYRDGYTMRAKKIKQGKIWKNWGIAFGVNLVIVLALSAGG